MRSSKQSSRQTEQHDGRLFADNPQPMWIYDLGTLQFLDVNEAAIKHYGYTRDEFMAMTLKDVRPKEDVEALLKDIDLARLDRSPGSEWRHVKKNGEQIIVEIVAHSLTCKGRPARHVMITDVTYRRRMEEALRESELKFRKIYESGPYGMVLVGSDRRFIMANNTFCRITGYRESELKKLSFLDITYAEDRDEGNEAYRNIREGKVNVYKTEKRYVRKDGTILWGSVTVTASFDDKGNYLYSLGTVEDITERKRAEEKIRLLNLRLTQLIEAIQKISAADSLDAIMKTVRATARNLMNADGATFILRDGDQSWYVDEEAIALSGRGSGSPLRSVSADGLSSTGRWLWLKIFIKTRGYRYMPTSRLLYEAWQ